MMKIYSIIQQWVKTVRLCFDNNNVQQQQKNFMKKICYEMKIQFDI